MKKISLPKIPSYFILSFIILGALLAASMVGGFRLSRPRGFNFNGAASAQSGGWVQQTSGVTDTLWSVHFINDNRGWAAGENATLLRTTNGGASWTPVSNCVSTFDGFFSVRFLDQSVGWAGGAGAAAQTGNGGSGFNCGVLDVNAFHNSFFPTSASQAWSAGFYVQPDPPNFNCRFLSRIAFDGALFTEENFTGCPGPSLYDIYFVGASNGWAVGETGAIVRIANATAATPVITSQTSGTTQLLWGIYMLDLNTGWAVGDGGTILKTTNGGANWSPQNSGTTTDLRDVHFVDASKGWVVGTNGIILTTTNGGASWAQEPSGVTDELDSVFFSSPNVGYAAGQNGVILKRTVGCPSITVSPATIPPGTAGVTYSPTTFTATGGSAPYTFSRTGALPAGMTFVSGTLSGTPAQTGSFPITVTATDASGCTGSRNYTLTINCPTIVVNPSSIPAGTTGVAYNQPFTQTGGVGSVSFSLNSGALPGGLTLSSGGLLSGAPAQCGSFNFVVKATDANNCMGTRSYTLLVNGPAITVNPPTLPGGTVGTPYDQTLSVTGGAAPHSFSVTSGSLPPGLTLASGGTLTGTPATQGTFDFTVTATDANGCTGSQAYTVAIAPGALAGLQYYPLPFPVRLLDMRPDPAFPSCFPSITPLTGGGVLTLPVIGNCNGLNIPTSAKAVVGNATVVNFQSGGGFITLFPSGAPQPNASNLNFVANHIVPNSFTVGLGGAGAFNIFTSAATNFIIDITGYYAPPGAGGLYFHPLPFPVRMLDTRPDPFTSCVPSSTPLVGGGTLTLPVVGNCNGLTIPTSAKALVGNATVVNFQSGGGFITLFPSDATLPNASNLNFTASHIVPNSFVVGLSAAGSFNIFTSASTNFIVDIAGYFSDQAMDENGQGLLFYPLSAPARWLDTRPDPPFVSCILASTPFAAGSIFTLQAQMVCEGQTVPATAKSVLGNATVVNFQSGGGFVTLFPSDATLPNASNLNFTASHIVPNSFVVGLGGTGAFKIFTSAATNFIIDLSGYFAP